MFRGWCDRSVQDLEVDDLLALDLDVLVTTMDVPEARVVLLGVSTICYLYGYIYI